MKQILLKNAEKFHSIKKNKKISLNDSKIRHQLIRFESQIIAIVRGTVSRYGKNSRKHKDLGNPRSEDTQDLVEK